MRNPVIHNQTDTLTESVVSNSGKSNKIVWLALPGFMLLSGAVGSLQKIAQRFGTVTERDYDLFVANWMPWIAVACFAFGWLVTHWLEIAVSEKRSRFAKILFAIIILGGTLIAGYLQFVVRHAVLERFGSTSILLVISGYFLRLSMFQIEHHSLLRYVIFSRTK